MSSTYFQESIRHAINNVVLLVDKDSNPRRERYHTGIQVFAMVLHSFNSRVPIYRVKASLIVASSVYCCCHCACSSVLCLWLCCWLENKYIERCADRDEDLVQGSGGLSPDHLPGRNTALQPPWLAGATPGETSHSYVHIRVIHVIGGCIIYRQRLMTWLEWRAPWHKPALFYSNYKSSLLYSGYFFPTAWICLFHHHLNLLMFIHEFCPSRNSTFLCWISTSLPACCWGPSGGWRRSRRWTLYRLATVSLSLRALLDGKVLHVSYTRNHRASYGMAYGLLVCLI